ncbi:hypothetical protein GJ496_001732 [Pomphorhynchus laevis]|nr:hypothetical protein GJ496_001732 [Pomphorhynchus laevis]
MDDDIDTETEKILEELECNEKQNDILSEEQLRLLGQSKELKLILRNRCLRRIIKDLNGHDNPENVYTCLMQEPLFSEFVTLILNIVDPLTNK